MGLISRISRYLKAEETVPKVGVAKVIPEQPLYLQFSRIGGNLTPLQVSSIIQQADSGSLNQLVDLSNECRQKDGTLHSVLSTRENALATLELVVDPVVQDGEVEPDERDLEVARTVEFALECADGGTDTISLHDCICHINSGVYFGFSVSEIQWEIKDGLIVPTGFLPINHRRFEFDQSDGKLKWRDWFGTSEGIDIQQEYPGKFIQHQPRVNGDVPAREGLNKLLVWPALFRNWSTADWMKLAELSWKPWRIGKYSFKANDDDKDDLLTALRTLTTNGVCVHRDDHQLDIRWPSGSGGGGSGALGKGPHEHLCDFMGREMAKAVLGQTLTVEPGERGARSLGEVHDRVRRDIREQDARAVAATLKRDLVYWIVKMNFGDDVSIPGLRFVTDDSVDLEAFSSAVKNLSDAGVPLHVSWVHDQIGHPELEEEEILVTYEIPEETTEEAEEEAEEETE